MTLQFSLTERVHNVIVLMPNRGGDVLDGRLVRRKKQGPAAGR